MFMGRGRSIRLKKPCTLPTTSMWLRLTTKQRFTWQAKKASPLFRMVLKILPEKRKDGPAAHEAQVKYAWEGWHRTRRLSPQLNQCMAMQWPYTPMIKEQEQCWT